jgi:single-strand DNA-binding protein
MNVVILIGRLTRDPELKFGQSGKAYSRFSIAVNRQFAKDEADFINCVAFGKTAEFVGEYLRKGAKVAINGRLQMNKYESNGEKRTTYDVVVDNLEFAESKQGGADSDTFKNNNSFRNEGEYTGRTEAKSSGPAQDDFEPSASAEFDDDEFPF